jgi:hypothetical protein
MKRTKWTTATYNCAGWITRYTPRRTISDASNVGKCELDFLEKAGVIANDSLIRPLLKDIQYDPNGEDLIVIMLQRLYPRIGDTAPKKVVVPKHVDALPPVTRAPKGGDSRINGKSVSYGEVLRAAGLTADKTTQRATR